MSKPKSRAQLRKEEQSRENGMRLYFKGFDCTTPESTQEFMQHIYKLILEEKVPKKELDVGDDVLECIYSMGFAFYQESRYEKAFPLFHLLVLLDPFSAKYLFSYAACAQMMGDFTKAMQGYAASSIADPSDPTALMRMSECALKLDFVAEAKQALIEAIKISANDSQYKELQQRAEAVLKSL